MRDVVAAIPLVGVGPILVISAIAVFFLVMAVLAWRNHQVWRVVCALLFVVFGLGAVADYRNTRTTFYDTVADLLQIPSYPTSSGTAIVPGETHPDGVVISLDVPDTASQFGSFPANIWLPPQYFTDPGMHFPIQILIAGNPGSNSNWFDAPQAAQTALVAAKAGKPVILVLPTVLKNSVTGDSLCLDTEPEGHVETYLTKDVLSAVDSKLRTVSNAKGRGIGGLSMGGYCALNLGLKHPDLFSVALDFSGETTPVADTLPGGIQALFGANWQQQADANDPTKYYTRLDPSKGPALWMDVGQSDEIRPQVEKLAGQLKAKGFTVELHTRPGAHDFTTFGLAFKDALPWATARFYS